MEEKIITGHKNGMLVLLLELVLYIAAVVFLIVGIRSRQDLCAKLLAGSG